MSSGSFILSCSKGSACCCCLFLWLHLSISCLNMSLSMVLKEPEHYLCLCPWCWKTQPTCDCLLLWKNLLIWVSVRGPETTNLPPVSLSVVLNQPTSHQCLCPWSWISQPATWGLSVVLNQPTRHLCLCPWCWKNPTTCVAVCGAERTRLPGSLSVVLNALIRHDLCTGLPGEPSHWTIYLKLTDH